MNRDRAEFELTILMPCLNEAETIGDCIDDAGAFLAESGVSGEILISDNGSTDGSIDIAVEKGARVVHASDLGYGAALRAGLDSARGRFVILGDADRSYDFGQLEPFIAALRSGDDLVMGNRFQGGIAPNAMPPLHRYLGNPVLSWTGRRFFGSDIGDFHCGLRGINRASYTKLDLQTNGMEFASEMVVKATLAGMRVSEVPTTLSPDGRTRKPHLRTWRDGWRHLRFMLIYSPRWLFLYPGLAIMLIGLLLGMLVMPGPANIGPTTLDVHTLVYAAAMITAGFQVALFAVFTKAYGISTGLLPHDPVAEAWFKRVTLETGILVGVLLLILGIGLTVYALWIWGELGLGPLDVGHTMRLVVPAALLLVLGTQVVFSSFVLSVVGLNRKHDITGDAGGS